MKINDKACLWWRATRPFAFPASVIPVFLGTATAWLHNDINWLFFLFTLAGAMAMHGGANILNDIYDYKKGVDRTGTYGSSGILIEQRMSSRELLTEAILLYAVAAIIGMYLWIRVGWWVLWLGIIGISGGYFYTASFALKYRAMGDLCVFLFFGILITLGAFYVQTGDLSWIPVLYAIPIGLLIDGILHGNNLRDIQSDGDVGVVTLAGHLGIRGSHYFYLILVAGAFLSVPILIITVHLPWPSGLVFLSIPLAVRNVKTAFQSHALPTQQFAHIDAMGAQLQMAFGLLMTVGVILGKWF